MTLRLPALRAPDHLARLPDDDLARLLLIRHFEWAVLDLFSDGTVAGTTHTCLGQEYVPVALVPLLSPAFVFSNHRGHGHYLALFDDATGLLAEITGREGAVCGGRGGSQHLSRAGFCSTGIQGENVAAALGAALHMRRTGRSDLAVAFIGDGTWGQGVVYETLNMAQLWCAPLVIVVEHNGIAQSTPTGRAMAGSVSGRSAAFGISYQYVDSSCVLAIRDQVRSAIAAVRLGGGPLIIEFRTNRLGPHSKGDDHRDQAHLHRLRQLDWYERYARCHPGHFAPLDQRQRNRVAAVVSDVLARPLIAGSGR